VALLTWTLINQPTLPKNTIQIQQGLTPLGIPKPINLHGWTITIQLGGYLSEHNQKLDYYIATKNNNQLSDYTLLGLMKQILIEEEGADYWKAHYK